MGMSSKLGHRGFASEMMVQFHRSSPNYGLSAIWDSIVNSTSVVMAIRVVRIHHNLPFLRVIPRKLCHRTLNRCPSRRGYIKGDLRLVRSIVHMRTYAGIIEVSEIVVWDVISGLISQFIWEGSLLLDKAIDITS